LFGAVRPATGQGFALVLPDVSTAATQESRIVAQHRTASPQSRRAAAG